jgi:NAD(P)-dependent dehydrogenase (short-subunit alcohol dehydrogenase family)
MATILMTGGHTGLGLVASREIAGRYGCDLILAGRDAAKVEGAARQLRAETSASVKILEMDLNSLASVRAAAATCKAMMRSGCTGDQELQGIVCNAGAQFQGAATYSVDGYETTFAGNCLGHFLLVNLLLDALAARARVVWTTSGTHDPASMDGKTVGAAVEPDARMLVDQGRIGKPMSGGRRYATSKLCTILYAYELNRRVSRARQSIVSIAYDPGFMPETGMGRMAPSSLRTSAAKFLLRTMGVTMGQMPFSGEALGRLASDAEFADASGRYFHSKDGVLREARSSMASYDAGKAAKLWTDSANLVHFETERPRRLQ